MGLQEPVDGIARGEVEHLAEFVLRQSANATGVDDQSVKGGFRQVLARRGPRSPIASGRSTQIRTTPA